MRDKKEGCWIEGKRKRGGKEEGQEQGQDQRKGRGEMREIGGEIERRVKGGNT